MQLLQKQSCRLAERKKDFHGTFKFITGKNEKRKSKRTGKEGRPFFFKVMPMRLVAVENTGFQNCSLGHHDTLMCTKALPKKLLPFTQACAKKLNN